MRNVLSFSKLRGFKAFKRRCHSHRVAFFGTDNFSLPILRALWDSKNGSQRQSPHIRDIEVICHSHKCPVYEYATSHNIPILPWPIKHDIYGRYDVGVLASFGHMIPARIIDSFPFGILNVHPSLLPRLRGAAPIVYTCLYGDTESGVSIMQIDRNKFDTGPVLLQEPYDVPLNCDTLQLSDDLSAIGAKMILRVLEDIPYYQTHAVPQDSSRATYAPKLKGSMANINWEEQTCDEISRQYRAIHTYFPLRTEFHGRPIKLHDLTPPTNHLLPSCPKLGHVMFCPHHESLNVACQDGCVAFKSIILRKPMSAKDFYNGYLSKIPPSQHYFTSLHNGLDLRTSPPKLNTEGLTSPKRDIIKHLADSNDANIILLQETHQENPDNLKIDGYDLIAFLPSKRHGIASYAREGLNAS